jgi:hypothetical protein
MENENKTIVYSVTIVGTQKMQEIAQNAWGNLQKEICDALAGKAAISFTQSNRD